MPRYDYLIIGGGVAGVTAAETIREESLYATIGVISHENHIFYSRVLLPVYLKKRIRRDQLFLRTVADFISKNIDLYLSEEVAFIDTKQREVGLRGGVRLGYEKLLIASGGKARPWDRAEEEKFLYRLQTIDDADRLSEKLDEVKKPLVVGSSFISLEFLEIFVANNILPTLLVHSPFFFPKFVESRGGEMLRENFDRHDVKMQFDDAIASIAERGEEVAVATQGLRMIGTDMVAVGIGIDRNTGFLQGSGIALGEKGVLTNEFLETNIPGILAAGDVAEFSDVILQRRHVIGNWTNAFLQGRVAGHTMAGRREVFRSVPAYSITNLGFQITALGVSDENVESIVRSDSMRHWYERFFLRDGVMIGAFLINRFQDKAHLTKIIASRTNMESYRDRLSDFGFDIREIPIVEYIHG